MTKLSKPNFQNAEEKIEEPCRWPKLRYIQKKACFHPIEPETASAFSEIYLASRACKLNSHGVDFIYEFAWPHCGHVSKKSEKPRTPNSREHYVFGPSDAENISNSNGRLHFTGGGLQGSIINLGRDSSKTKNCLQNHKILAYVNWGPDSKPYNTLALKTVNFVDT